MGYKSKTTEREHISGHHVAIDIQDGTHAAEDLARRNEARGQAIYDAHKADWAKDMLSVVPEDKTPILADAMSKAARPTDYSSKGENRFGVAGGDNADPGKTVNNRKPAPDSNAKVSK
jgi:hypothetical protein